MSLRIAIGPSSFAEVDQTPLTKLQTAGVQIVPNPYGRRLTKEEIVEHLKGCDGLIAGLEPLNREVLASAAPKLKAIARVGIGVANVDFDAADEFGIKVSRTPEGPTVAVAELTLAALLNLTRRLEEMNRRLHGGAWPKLMATSMQGMPVLLIGYGRIGRRVGSLLRAFDARVLVHDPEVQAEDLTDGEQLVSLEEGLPIAQAISLHASGKACILCADQFDLMRNGVLILNSARGELVDEQALIEALDSGKVGGGWFDTFWKEPYKGRLLEYDQMLLTPHAATYTVECRLSMESTAVDNLLRDLGLAETK